MDPINIAGTPPKPQPQAQLQQPASLVQQPIQPTGLPKATALFREAFEIYKTKFWEFIYVYLWTFLLCVIVMVPAVILFFIGAAMVNSGVMTEDTAMIPGIILAIIAGIALIYVSIWGQVAMILRAKHRNEVLHVKQVFELSKPFIASYFFTSILAGLYIMLGFVILIIPGLYLAVALSLTTYIILDGKKGMEAINLSRDYVKGYWFKVLRLIGFIIVVIMLITYVPIIFLPEEVGSIVNAVVSILLGPLSTIYSYLMYEKFKLLKPQLASQ